MSDVGVASDKENHPWGSSLSKTPSDIIMYGTFFGLVAGLSGIAAAIDRKALGGRFGFKSNLSDRARTIRGAALGGVLSLPVAYYVTKKQYPDSNVIPQFFGAVPVDYSNPPDDYVYAERADGSKYLIVDPKYGL